MKTPVVSIIICTRNRADSLRETLASIGKCEVPADLPAELVVVDNGSTDNTRQVVEQAGLTNLPVRYVVEPRAGQCFARNTGLAAGRGKVILFTDDDVRVPPAWIEHMTRPVARGTFAASIGPIRCPFPEGLPHWYDFERVRGFAVCDPPIQDVTRWHDDLIGANMCFAREVVNQVGAFRTELGPGASGFFDDTEFSWRLHSAGFRVAFCPTAGVLHFPSTSRLNRRSLRREWFRLGYSSYLARTAHPDRLARGGDSLARRIYRYLRSETRRLRRRQASRTTQEEMFMWMTLGSTYASARRVRLGQVIRA